MSNFTKILLTIVCLYVLIAKSYVTFGYLISHYLDMTIQFVNCLVLFSCVYLPIIIWKEMHNIKYKVILTLLLFIAIALQLFYGLFDYFSKDPRINQIKVLWTFDIPNLLSILIMGSLIFLTMKKDKQKAII